MSAFIMFLGLFGSIACIALLIVRAIKKEPLKPVAIGFAVCLVLFIVGGSSMSGSSKNDSGKEKTASATPEPAPTSETRTGPKKKPMSPSVLDTETSAETQSEPQETASAGYSIMFGDLLDANPSGGVDGNTLVIKAKIHSQITNKQTINQNYHNVEDIIKNQGGDQFNCIDYWAVADMSDGSEQKVVAFTLNSNVIQGVANGNIVAIEFEDYVDDLFIHQSPR